MDKIFINAVFNKASKEAEFVTSSHRVDSLEHLLGDKASQYTWLKPYKDKNGKFPSKWMFDEITWEQLQYLKEISKITSGNERTIRIWIGKSHLDLAWSSDSPFELYGSYRVHVTGPLHWRSIDILGMVISRYVQGRGIMDSESIFNEHLLEYMNTYQSIPCIFQVENVLWDMCNPVFSDFKTPGIYSVCHVTSNDWLLQVHVHCDRLRLTVHKLGLPWEQTECISSILYRDNWEALLMEKFLDAVKEYSSK